MIAWVKEQGDIDYVVVYHWNRIFRNSIDAAITKRELAKVGTRIVSSVIDLGETPEAALIESVLHAVDQYQSEATAADVRYKMSQKVKNGGSVGLAPLGYLNVRIPRPGGGEIRTVELDPDRAELVRLSFELYATGDYTLLRLADELTTRGLRTRPGRFPATTVSDSKLSSMLSDTYYLGYVRYRDPHDGETQLIKGRHEPLVDEATFERCQHVQTARRKATERQRQHHHYLKGSLWCGECHDRGVLSRMIYTKANGRGGTYEYFVCRAKAEGSCDSPHLPAEQVEARVTAYVTRRALTESEITQLEANITSALHETHSAEQIRRRQLEQQIAKLDQQQSNLLDLAADGTGAATKIRARLHDIDRKRARIQAELAPAQIDLATGERYLRLAAQLMHDID